MFAEEYGYAPTKMIQYETISDELRRRVWNLFYRTEIDSSGLNNQVLRIGQSRTSRIEAKIADRLGFILDSSQGEHSIEKELKSYLLEKCSWFDVYNFIEIHLANLIGESRTERIQQYNQLLEDEKSGYRVIDGKVVPITSPTEFLAIETVINSPYVSVTAHMRKALSLYADLEKPDYENSIKESISAVEAMCCIINGKDTTLNKVIDKLKNNGIHIHPSLEKGFISIYGYACDEKGIRHAGRCFVNAPAEDAKYMLISCSAFVNYLMEKWGDFGQARS